MARDVVISGISETSLSPQPGASDMSLIIEASLAAIDDAGLEVGDIDGILCMPPWESPSERYHMLVTEQLNIFAKALCDSIMLGGASPCAAIQIAQWAVASGKCEHVLIVSGEPQFSRFAGDGGVLESFAKGAAHNTDYEFPFGVHVPAYYALVAQRSAQRAFDRALAGGDGEITEADVLDAVAATRPSVSAEASARFAEEASRYARL